MTQRSEFWALTLRIADTLRDPAAYGDNPPGIAAAWKDELTAILDRLSECPDESFRRDPVEQSEITLREHLAWAFLNAVSRDLAKVSVEPERGR
jgi:hypothetical protein